MNTPPSSTSSSKQQVDTAGEFDCLKFLKPRENLNPQEKPISECLDLQFGQFQQGRWKLRQLIRSAKKDGRKFGPRQSDETQLGQPSQHSQGGFQTAGAAAGGPLLGSPMSASATLANTPQAENGAGKRSHDEFLEKTLEDLESAFPRFEESPSPLALAFRHFQQEEYRAAQLRLYRGFRFDKFASLEESIRKRIWSMAVPRRILMSPKFGGLPCHLLPPDIMKVCPEASEVAKSLGEYYRLGWDIPSVRQAKTWFSPDRDILYFPSLCFGNDGVHKHAKDLLMENVRLDSPRTLRQKVRKLVSRSHYPNIKTIYLGSNVVLANSIWEADAVQEIFGGEGVRMVDMLNPQDILEMWKLMDFYAGRAFSPAEFKTVRELFECEASRFLQDGYWESMEEHFQDAWLTAKWYANECAGMVWAQHDIVQAIPFQLIQKPSPDMVGYLKGAVSIKLDPPADEWGRWRKSEDWEKQLLSDMPELRPVFAFILPEQIHFGLMA